MKILENVTENNSRCGDIAFPLKALQQAVGCTQYLINFDSDISRVH